MARKLPKSLLHRLRRLPFLFWYCLAATGLLLVLARFLWPTPDEYFYGSIARSFVAASQGQINWIDINTEHNAFVPLLAALTSLNKFFTFFCLRLPVIAFAIGSIVLIYRIAKSTTKQANWWLWLLLLIPGFWLFSSRLMLDVPATFSVIFLIYCLVNRLSISWLSISLLLVLLTKEYYLLVTLPIVVTMVFFDQYYLNPSEGWARRLYGFSCQLILAYLPSLLAIVILLDFDFLPYPRLLENSLYALFGDFFDDFQQKAASNLEVIAKFLQSHGLLLSSPPTISQGLPPPISTPALPLEPHAPAQTGSFLTRLWWIYRDNLSEENINIFLLPLTIIGIASRLRNLKKKLIKDYLLNRKDLIFFILILVFTYFNYTQADWAHGFRITIPVVVGLLYFAYFGAERLLIKPRARTLWLFGALTTLSLVGYLNTTASAPIGTILQGLPLIENKATLLTFFFFGVSIFLLFFHRLASKNKYVFLMVLILFMFFLKIGPILADNIIREQKHGFDYSADEAMPTLKMLSENNQLILANTNPYRLQFYTEDVRIRNSHIKPIVRSFRNIYPQNYFGGQINNDLIAQMRKLRINYLLVTNGGLGENDLSTIKQLTKLYPDTLQEIARDQSSIMDWIIYRVNY